MKQLNNRELKLLNYLSRKTQHTTADELAIEFETSVKTVYRMIKRINELSQNEKVIMSEKGKGYKINFETYIDVIESSNSKRQKFSTNERRSSILRELLIASPDFVNLNKLYEKYYVSDNVVFHDEKIFLDIITDYDLVYQRKNKLANITGSEVNIRKAISAINTSFTDVNFEQILNDKDDEFNLQDKLFVLEQLKLIEVETNGEIPYPYNINIFSHLYIVIDRIRKSNYLLKNDIKIIVDSKQRLIDENLEIYNLASRVICNIEKFLNVDLPEEEVINLFQYLLASRINRNLDAPLVTSKVSKEITEYYITNMKALDMSIGDARMIYNELCQHIKPMINRLYSDISIKNTLLDSIKLEYPSLFENISKLSVQVEQEFNLSKISEDEIGFITLYFASLSEQNSRKLKVLITCTTGVGTSELLKVKVSKKFPDIEIIAITSLRDLELNLEKYHDIDLIISTVNLPYQLHIPLIVVSALFTSGDQQRVNKIIKEITDEWS